VVTVRALRLSQLCFVSSASVPAVSGRAVIEGYPSLSLSLSTGPITSCTLLVVFYHQGFNFLWTSSYYLPTIRKHLHFSRWKRRDQPLYKGLDYPSLNDTSFKDDRLMVFLQVCCSPIRNPLCETPATDVQILTWACHFGSHSTSAWGVSVLRLSAGTDDSLSNSEKFRSAL